MYIIVLRHKIEIALARHCTLRLSRLPGWMVGLHVPLKVDTGLITLRTQLLGGLSLMNSLDVHKEIVFVFSFKATPITVYILLVGMHVPDVLLQRLLRPELFLAVLADRGRLDYPLMFRHIALVLSQMSVKVLGEAATPRAIYGIDLGVLALHVRPHVLAYVVAVRALGQLVLVVHVANMDPEVLAHHATVGAHLLLRLLFSL